MTALELIQQLQAEVGVESGNYIWLKNYNIMKSYFVICILFFSCVRQKTNTSISIDQISENQDYSWFKTGYKDYQPDAGDVNLIKKIPEAFTIIVFGGVWCPDTQKHLPEFYKTTDLASIPRNKITFYHLNKEKKSDEGFEKKYKIVSVPTFIVLNNGIEIGRIVEVPTVSIEKDLANIILKN